MRHRNITAEDDLEDLLWTEEWIRYCDQGLRKGEVPVDFETWKQQEGI